MLDYLTKIHLTKVYPPLDRLSLQISLNGNVAFFYQRERKVQLDHQGRPFFTRISVSGNKIKIKIRNGRPRHVTTSEADMIGRGMFNIEYNL